MPFIRYSRDRRGYETTVVLHAYRTGQGTRTRVLYVFRSPSNIRIGRRPLDPEVMEALEHTHPDLTFDWAGLHRESAPRQEGRDRPERWRGRSDASAAPVVEVAPTIIEDESLLGRTLGPEAALRLRGRYNEVLQRIGRRARTPEDRERLTDRAMRLNPDEWQDEATIRASVEPAQAEWEAILAELPQRRRGRRGGRRDAGSTAPVSAIIRDEGDSHEPAEEVLDAGLAGPNVGAGDSGDRRGVGTDATTTADPSPDSAPRDPAVPSGGDGHHD